MSEQEKKKSSYISGRESRRITRFNRKTTRKLEEKRAAMERDPALYTTKNFPFFAEKSGIFCNFATIFRHGGEKVKRLILE